MINNHNVYIIAAIDKNNGIGKNGELPWHFKRDLKHFAKVTKSVKDSKKQNMVIMGRTTWESLPPQQRPLKSRKNVILTNQPKYEAEFADIVGSLEAAYQLADESIHNIFIIGGAQIYQHAMNRDEIDGVYLTRIHGTFDCDTFFPAIPPYFSAVRQLGTGLEKSMRFTFLQYIKPPR